MSPRRNRCYFKREKETPDPVVIEIKSRVRFSDVDAMGIVWHGRYSLYFEEGFSALSKFCNISYLDLYKANLRAPIIEFHVDYFEPLHIDEEFTIRTSMVWDEAAKLNFEYQLIKIKGNIASSGYTVELFTDDKGEVCIASPPLLVECRRRWKNGEFS